VNRDTLKTAAKCKQVAEAAFAEGKSVVIDNTNGSTDTRAEYIRIAQNKQIPVRCFYFNTPLDIANHLNFVRVKESNGGVRRIPPVAYHTYQKKFSVPEVGEGFEEVIEVEFAPDFPDAEFKKMFLCYTPEF